MDDVRIAQNEVLFRQVNEAIEPRDADGDDRAKFLCECGRLGCTDRIELDISTYESVRRDLNRFLLVPGHQQSPDVILEQHDTYLVVAKEEGAPAQVARQDDPRADALGA